MTTAKLANYHGIIRNGKEVGKIQILNYYESGVPQLEYDLDKEYWNKGIMTQELKDYIERIKDNYKFLIAIVKKDNLASMRVLEKIGFSDFFLFKKTGYKFYIKIL